MMNLVLSFPTYYTTGATLCQAVPGCLAVTNELWTGIPDYREELFPEFEFRLSEFRPSLDIPEIEKIVKSHTDGKVERYIYIYIYTGCL